jgi:transposase
MVKKMLYSDTMFARMTKSLRQHTFAQIFMDSIGFIHAYPMKKSEASDRLKKLLRTLQTIPEMIVTDGVAKETSGDWKRTLDKYWIQDKRTEPYSPWQNQAEHEIWELMKVTRQILHSSKAPSRTWCFDLEWATEIRRHIVHDIAALTEQMPFEHYTGHTPNIAALCTYSFYDYCWFWDSEEGFPNQQRVLGHWLGISHDIGGPLTYYVFPKSCWPTARSSITTVTLEELLEPANKALAEELDKAIKVKISKFRTDKEVAEDDGDLEPFDVRRLL